MIAVILNLAAPGSGFTQMPEHLSFLIAEDDESFCRALKSCLEPDAEVVTSDTAEEAIALVCARRFDAVIVDIHLAGFTTGIYLIRRIAQISEPYRPVTFVITGADASELSKIDREVVNAVFLKPANIEAMCRYFLRTTAAAA
jgi:CheY-like chemotaxis protein